MSALSARKRATYADVLAAPENMVAEILNGELVLSPRPAARHARTCSRLGFHLGAAEPGQGGGRDAKNAWWILDEPEIHLGDHVLVPDLAGWRTSTMPEIPDVAYFELRPDWVCEVLSPGTETRDRALKLAIYGEHGVGWTWLLNPRNLTLEAYRRDGAHWVLLQVYSGDLVVRVEPFSDIELPLSDLWLKVPEGGK